MAFWLTRVLQLAACGMPANFIRIVLELMAFRLTHVLRLVISQQISLELWWSLWPFG